MTMEHIIVTDFNRELIASQSCKAFVIKTGNPDEIPAIHKAVEASNKLHCVYLRTEKTLPEIEYKEEFENIPVAVGVPRVGPFRFMAGKAARLRASNVRVLLDSSPENITSARILSSAGISCALSIDGEKVNWEELCDLLSYAVYTKMRHADIEPIASRVRAYKPDKLGFFPSAHFTDPSSYLFCGGDGRLALSETGLAAGEFVGELKELGAVRSNPAYIERAGAWREHFLAIGACSKCPGWRVCGGTFSSSAAKNPGCEKFFPELMEAADYAAGRKDKRKEVWRI